MERDSCVVCDAAVGARQEGLQCDLCSKWQHRKCNSGVTRELYRRLVRGVADLEQWKCRDCTEQDSTISFNPTVESTRVSAVSLDDDVVSDDDVIPDVPPADDDVVPEDDVVPDVPPADDELVPADDVVPDVPPADDDVVPADDDAMQDVSYQIPAVVQESSLNDPTPHIEPGQVRLTYTLVPGGTKRGKAKLVDSLGYTYNIFRKTSEYSQDWQCTVRSKKLRCRATVKQRGDHYTAGTHPHLHEADPGALAKMT